MTRWACALFCAALGCAGPSPESVAQRSEAIIDGESSGSEEDGVVMLHALLDDAGEVLCSGSLVAPNLVLTARHCVSYLMPGRFSCNVRGELLDNPEGGGTLGAHLPAESIEIHGRATPRETPLAHGQQIISTLAQGICTNDLAFVVLDTPLDLPVVPLRLGSPALLGETGNLVGFGLTKAQKVLDYRTQPRAHKASVAVADLGPDTLEEGVTTAPPRSLIIKGPSGCVGDSGGPLLAESGALLGVYSLLDGASCEESQVRHQLVHVPPFQALIDEAFEAAQATPTLETIASAGEGGASGAPSTEPVAGGDAGGSRAGAPVTDDGEGTSCAMAAPKQRGAAQLWPALLLVALAGRRRRARA